MNILFVGDFSTGGELVSTRRLFEGLRKNDDTVRLFAVGLSRNPIAFPPRLFEETRTVLRSPYPAFAGTIRAAWLDALHIRRELLHIKERARADVVICTDYVATLAARSVYTAPRVPVLHFFHGWRSSYVVNPSGRTFQERFMFFVEKLAMRIAAKVVVPCVFSEKHLKQYLGAKIRISIVPAGLPSIYFSGKLALRPRFRSLVLSENHAGVLLYCGRIVAHKGLSVLAESLSLFSEKERPILIVAAPNDNRDIGAHAGFLRKIRSLGITDSVRFVFDTDEQALPALYRAADACILPSESEQLPLSLLESFASKTLFLGTATGDMPAYLTLVDARLILKDATPSGIQGKIAWALALSHAAREKIVNKAAAVARRHTIEKSVASFYAALSELTNTKNRGF